MKKIIFLSLALFGLISAKAQQEFMITHYMFNGLALNPAYAGVHENITASVLHRSQWVGIPGAPTTQLASVHGALRGTGASLGAVFYRDVLGAGQELGTYLSAAYRIPITKKMKLSLGLQGNLFNYNKNYSSELNSGRRFQNDQSNLSDASSFNWNMGAGMMLHTDKFFLGLSVPQIMNKRFNIDNPDADGNYSLLERHFYLYSGYAFELSENFVLKPNVLLKAVPDSPTEIDLNANALISKFLWLGVSYRSFDSVDGLIGFQITPQFVASYALDITLTEIENLSHEFMLSYTFNLQTDKILTPRYF